MAVVTLNSAVAANSSGKRIISAGIQMVWNRLLSGSGNESGRRW